MLRINNLKPLGHSIFCSVLADPGISQHFRELLEYVEEMVISESRVWTKPPHSHGFITGLIAIAVMEDSDSISQYHQTVSDQECINYVSYISTSQVTRQIYHTESGDAEILPVDRDGRSLNHQKCGYYSLFNSRREKRNSV